MIKAISNGYPKRSRDVVESNRTVSNAVVQYTGSIDTQHSS
jgi:hypothetical protein